MGDLKGLLKLLNEKGYLQDVPFDTILEDEDIRGYMGEKVTKKKKTPPPSVRQGEYDPDKCQARIWAEGYDSVQCSFSPNDGECFCKRHAGNSWWLGKIPEQRPENPRLYSKAPPDGLEHEWKKEEIEENVEEEIKVEKPRKRGRPKGSKNKKKKEPKEKDDMTIEEIQALILKKQQGQE